MEHQQANQPVYPPQMLSIDLKYLHRKTDLACKLNLCHTVVDGNIRTMIVLTPLKPQDENKMQQIIDSTFSSNEMSLMLTTKNVAIFGTNFAPANVNPHLKRKRANESDKSGCTVSVTNVIRETSV
jgi:hypothetical protein